MMKTKDRAHSHWRATKQLQSRVRALRRAMTPAEAKLWQHIRLGQLGGAHFRRQHAVGPYIVDFFCAKTKLVVEVDGDVHADSKKRKYDAERAEWLNEWKDYRMIRFWNSEVIRNMDAVLEKIQEGLSEKDHGK